MQQELISKLLILPALLIYSFCPLQLFLQSPVLLNSLLPSFLSSLLASFLFCPFHSYLCSLFPSLSLSLLPSSFLSFPLPLPFSLSECDVRRFYEVGEADLSFVSVPPSHSSSNITSNRPRRQSSQLEEPVFSSLINQESADLGPVKGPTNQVEDRAGKTSYRRSGKNLQQFCGETNHENLTCEYKHVAVRISVHTHIHTSQ